MSLWPWPPAGHMITVAQLQDGYKVRAERWDGSGFHYGVSYLQVYMTATASWVPFWWCSCRACGKLAVLSVTEVRRGRECYGCGFSSCRVEDIPDFDYTVDRNMRSWEVHQEALTSAYLLGGAEAAQTMATELHREVLASQAKHEARRKLAGPDPQP